MNSDQRRADVTNHRVCDIGLAAFLKLRGFKLADVTKDHLLFACETDADYRRVRELEIEYLNSDFVQFDGMVMELKRMPIAPEIGGERTLYPVRSIGQATFMQVWRGKLVVSGSQQPPPWTLAARTADSCWAFEVGPRDTERFVSVLSSWPNHELRSFNSEIIAVKLLRRRCLSKQDV